MLSGFGKSAESDNIVRSVFVHPLCESRRLPTSIDPTIHSHTLSDSVSPVQSDCCVGLVSDGPIS